MHLVEAEAVGPIEGDVLLLHPVDALPSLDQFLHQNKGRFRLEVRITSYNVCYTKLLRAGPLVGTRANRDSGVHRDGRTARHVQGSNEVVYRARLACIAGELVQRRDSHGQQQPEQGDRHHQFNQRETVLPVFPHCQRSCKCHLLFIRNNFV